MDKDLQERIAKIRLLVMDSDGVLTDGGVYMDEEGREFRRFDIKDGLGLKRVMEAGIAVAIISASSIESVRHRAEKLGISEVHIGIQDKLFVLQEICQRLGITLDQVAYIGDDLADLAILREVSLACAPADAVEEVKAVAKLVTSRPGGHGAVREVCDVIVNNN
jgi:3-deoxy-D-manno-octulosonate 8-phosphate phosphatase (KDO 8-P phosphatase)